MVALTEDERGIIKTAVRKKLKDGMTEDDKLAGIRSNYVMRKSIWTLRKEEWLNDEVVNYFYLMLGKKEADKGGESGGGGGCHFFTSFFVDKLMQGARGINEIKRWTKRVDVFSLEKIFFPVHVGINHWACAVIYMQERRIQFYDSLRGGGMEYLKQLWRFLKLEHFNRKGMPLPDQEAWKLEPCTRDTPTQENGE
jgi:sentrin-specific protease 1